MRDLTELVHSLQWGKLKLSAWWDIVLQPGSKMAQLFDAIYQHKASTEEEANALIYPSARSLAQLRSLKNKLKERLLEVVFLLDFQDTNYTDRQKAHFECNKRWATAMTLLTKKIKLVGIDLLEQLLKHSRHFEFTDLSMNALYHLRLHYGTLVDDSKKYEMYRDLHKQYQTIWFMENEVEERYTDLISRYVSSRAPQQEVAEKAATYFKEIEPYLQRSNSFRLQLCGRLLQLMVYSGRSDYQSIADLCQKSIAFFQQKPYSSHLPKQAFYYQLVVSCVQLRDFGRGQAIIREHGHIYEVGTFNWFKVQELFLLLALHTQHYDDAYDCCEAVLETKELAQQPAQIQEMWKIYEAYMQVLVQMRRVDRLPAKKFKLAKFLNETPVFSKDKRGMNIPILIVQMLFDILDKRFDAGIDRVEAVEKYTSRYVKRDEHFRSNCFLKMLIQIPEASFHRAAASRKAERFQNQMSEMPLELANQPHEIEIIPYDELWGMILEMLPNQRINRKP